MTTMLRWSSITCLGASLLLSVGCAVTDGGYGPGYDVGVDAGYYEPGEIDYGGWGPDYYVGPYRDGYGYGGRGGYGGGRRSGRHAYRAAPSSRSMPSVPSGRRSGGAHGGSGGRRSR